MLSHNLSISQKNKYLSCNNNNKPLSICLVMLLKSSMENAKVCMYIPTNYLYVLCMYYMYVCIYIDAISAQNTGKAHDDYNKRIFQTLQVLTIIKNKSNNATAKLSLFGCSLDINILKTPFNLLYLPISGKICPQRGHYTRSYTLLPKRLAFKRTRHLKLHHFKNPLIYHKIRHNLSIYRAVIFVFELQKQKNIPSGV